MFSSCTGLSDVALPNVTSIGNYAFDGCSSLSTLSINAINAPTIAANTFRNVSSGAIVFVPSNCSQAYKASWTALADQICDMSVMEITDGVLTAYKGDSSSVTLPLGVKEIANGVFKGKEISEIVLPDSLEKIDNEAFMNAKLTSMVIPSGVTYIGDRAFGSNPTLTSVVFSGEVPAQIGADVFIGAAEGLVIIVNSTAYSSYMSSEFWSEYKDLLQTKEFEIKDGVLTAYYGNGGEVTIPDGVTVIGSYAFSQNKNITKVVLPESVEIIKAYAFSYMAKLEEFDFAASSVTAIEQYAFYEDGALKTVTMPNSVRSIAIYAFKNCVSLESINLSTALTEIANQVFYNCVSLKEITLPDGVTTIGAYAFYKCANLTCFVIGENSMLKTLGAYSFACSGLTGEYEFNSNLTALNTYTFAECNNITKITFNGNITNFSTSVFNMANLEELIFNGNVAGIGSYAISICNSLKRIVFNGTVGTVGVNSNGNIMRAAMAGYPIACNDSLEEVYFYKSVDVIGGFCFQSCPILKTVYFGDKVSTFDIFPFTNCPMLKSFTVPESNNYLYVSIWRYV